MTLLAVVTPLVWLLSCAAPAQAPAGTRPTTASPGPTTVTGVPPGPCPNGEWGHLEWVATVVRSDGGWVPPQGVALAGNVEEAVSWHVGGGGAVLVADPVVGPLVLRGTAPGLVVAGCGVELTRVEATSTDAAAVDAEDAQELVVADLTVVGGQQGVRLLGATKMGLERVRVEDSVRAGVAADPAAIELWLDEVEVVRPGWGGLVGAWDTFSATQVAVRDGDGPGLQVAALEATVQDLEVSGVRSSVGVWLEGGSCALTDSSVEDVAGAGVHVSCADAVVERVQVQRVGEDPLALEVAGDGLRVASTTAWVLDNRVSGSVRAGVLVHGGSVSLAGNVAGTDNGLHDNGTAIWAQEGAAVHGIDPYNVPVVPLDW